jgi:hypothetical protein
MVAKNPAHNERRTGPGQASKGTTYHVDLEPSDIDSEIIDLIEVVEDEISATTDGAPSADEPSTPNIEEPDLFETLELGEAFPPEIGEADAVVSPAAAPIRQPRTSEPRREVPRHGVTPEFAERPVDQEGEGADDLRDLDTDQLLAEFLASEETDLPRRGREKGPSADENEIERPAAVGEDLLSELLKDLESTERAVAQEAGAVQPPPCANETPPDPALHDLDWVSSGNYYPQLIASLDKQIAECQQEFDKKIKELTVQRDHLKQNFEDVRSLLTGQEDELRKSIHRVFTTFWKLKVSELDANKKETFREDLLVEHNGRKIIFKIKSTTANDPSLKFIAQLWQELHYSGLGASTEGGLILNHNVGVEPESRGLAYTGDEEGYLEDIIFVDTRVLYNLTLAIIDYGLPVQEATELLLRTGRVKFQLDDVATQRL